MRTLVLTLSALIVSSCQNSQETLAVFCSDVNRDIVVYRDYSYRFNDQYYPPNPCGNIDNCYQVPFPIFDVSSRFLPGNIYQIGQFDINFGGPTGFISNDQIVDTQDFGYATRHHVPNLPPFTGQRLQYGVSYNADKGYFAVVSDDFGVLTICRGRLDQPSLQPISVR